MKKYLPILAVVAVAVSMSLVGCERADDEVEGLEEEPREEVELEAEEPGEEEPKRWNVRGYDLPEASRPYHNILASAQPSEEQLADVGELGVKKVINLRAADEDGFFDAEELLAQMGIDYVNIPVADPDDLSPEKVEEVNEALREVQGDALIHCGTSERAGAMLALRADQFLGAQPMEALRRGRVAGLDEWESDVRTILYK